MKNKEDQYKEFQDSIENMKGQFHVLETSVPVEKQMEYFHYSEKVRHSTKNISIEDAIQTLNNPDSLEDDKKFSMTFLAVSGDVKAYRALETYAKNPEELLKDWSGLSLLQAKIVLESEFSDEKQIFISTGLGGKGDNLRFYSFFKSKDLTPFSSYQIQLIEKEIPFFIQENHGIVEELNIESNYFTVVFLINIRSNIKFILESALTECNQYGDFISTTFIITNVKKFDEEDIKKELEKNG